jgi:hypothetical protein
MESTRRSLIERHPAQGVEVEVHLAHILRLESAGLQLDHDEAA